MAWWDFFKVFTYAFTDDPIAKKDKRTITGPGTSQPDAMPDLRAMADGTAGGGTSVRLRDTNDFIDLSTVTNRMHRYKEYDRLRSMAEIEMALTVFADEACMAGDTPISTPAYENGTCTLEWLAQHKSKEKFLVYAFDKDKGDYTLSWGYDPRLVGERDTFKVLLDDGSSFIFTYDHRVMMRDESWRAVGELRTGDKLMPFYRIPADQNRTHHKTNQYPRIFTHLKGWVHERQFVDEWRRGRDLPQYEELNKSCRMIASGLSVRKMQEVTGAAFDTMKKRITRAGFSNAELKWLGSKQDYRRVIGIVPNGKIPVYDLSVEKHACVCTNWGVTHNCQRDEDGRVLKVNCKNQEVTEELEFLLFHRKMLNLDQKKIWNRAKNLFAMGDDFWEVIIDPENPKGGIVDLQFLPPDSMYRIETTKGKVIEFQQSKEGPDYQSLSRVDVTQATEADLMQATAIRFAPEQIIHVKIGDERKTFYPYGISLIEAARGPAHQLRMMEDAMVVYRLTRAPERRVFYIDVQQLTPAKAEAFMERMKDQFKKKKSPKNNAPEGASSVEERWHAPAADEDYWIPIRPNANTRVETLPGAQNLGEIDDTVYFRNKLFIALNFPKNYFNNEDTQVSRISLSAQDIKFARMIERLQSHMEDALWELCDRHLRLRGYPEEAYEDLEIKMTPPSDWRELTRQEIVSARIQNAGSLKGSQLLSDFDILVEWMKYPEEQVKVMLARLKLQKLEELKFQIIAQNPSLAGVGVPPDDEQQIGSEGGPGNPMPGGMPGEEGQPPPDMGAGPEMGGAPAPQGPPPQGGGGSITAFPEPTDDDVHKYDMEINDFGSEQDEEETDLSQEQ